MSREDVRDGVALTRKGGTCVLTGMTSQLTQSVKINLQDFILMNKTLAPAAPLRRLQLERSSAGSSARSQSQAAVRAGRPKMRKM